MDEKRQGVRHRALRSGRIVFNFKRSVINCIVRNLSDGGACLQLSGTAGVPGFFELQIDGEKESRPCHIVWATDDRLGVEFTVNANQLSPVAEDRGNDGHPVTQADETKSGGIVRAELIAVRAALDHVPIGIVLLDRETRAQFINRAFRKMWRLPDEKADGKPPFVALMYHGRDTRAYEIPSGDIDAYVASRVEHIRSGDPRPLDLRLASGQIIRLQATKLENGGRMLCYTYVTDIAERADELGRLQGALDNIKQGVVLLDSMLNVQFMNQAARELWRVPEKLLSRGAPLIEFIADGCQSGVFNVPPEEIPKFVAGRIAIARAGDPTPADIPHRDGRVIRVQCSLLPNGGRMLNYMDVTDLVHRADQLEELAAIDALSGVYNRHQFNSLAHAEWNRFQRYHRPLSALLLDVDGFKQINDKYGHEKGDRVIALIGAICRQVKRTPDVVARIGGDEFCILLPETNLKQASRVAERIIENIARSELTDNEKLEPIAVRVSVGLAEAVLSMSSVATLISRADEALYRAKAAGRNRYVAAEAVPIDGVDKAAE